MIEIFGVALTSVNTITNLYKFYEDSKVWEQKDIIVDFEWLELAIDKGEIDGPMNKYSWSLESKLQSRILKGTHELYLGLCSQKQCKYRFVIKNPNGDLLVLVNKK